ncbi:MULTISPECIES: GntR family transcriptional regulator [Paenibacillus]|uniref:GntR family transcriptional regulator n=1 Tax=Paenibacillus TaxID=44249 RepID=UPI00020D73B7|nr:MULTISPECIES: GntR family transcriptional regulator [Paenibacillus]EGL18724.1 putative gluconate operon transcriptional repressor [Paenibacillus sp. HGF7]EPD92788.1 hypothetical protein HMPREF1207_00559 [Paenibacillus sp. HGH0039]MBV6713093.1 GntR family transcriptional regulator [Paenibacillus chitinolyticus]
MRYPSAWLRGVSLGESIASELRLQIINGSIKPGEVISENRIASDFGTSRSPVREALKALSIEGLIRLERMGAVVLGLSQTDVQELYDVRFIIESFVQDRLAQANQASLIGKLNQIIDRMELAVKHGDPEDFAFQDITFHETIIEAARHKRVLHLWTSIRQIVITVLLITTDEIFSQGEEKLLDVIEKHRAIVRGLETHDPAVIGQVVRNYFADSRQTLENSLPS